MLENLERIKQQFHEELSAVNFKGRSWRKSEYPSWEKKA